MEYFGYLASIGIGILLGLIGGGGSILTVPILVYLFHIHPQKATSYSLFIVGITAAIGAMRHFKLGNLKLRSALMFALPSLVSLLLVRKIALPAIPDSIGFIGPFLITKNLLIMLVFSVLMIAASVSMIRTRQERPSQIYESRLRLAIIGFSVGIVTGFLGAGGGFLIIPALIFFAGLPMKQAVGTSLLIIAINSLLGFAGDWIGGASLDHRLLLTVSATAICGIFIGTALSKKIDGKKLKPFFGWFVLVMGCSIIIRELFMG